MARKREERAQSEIQRMLLEMDFREVCAIGMCCKNNCQAAISGNLMRIGKTTRFSEHVADGQRRKLVLHIFRPRRHARSDILLVQ